MTRIKTVTMDNARGIQRLLLHLIKRQYGGFIPGIMNIALVDLNVGRRMGDLYKYLHLRKTSPITRLQREMLATIVNGVIGGAP